MTLEALIPSFMATPWVETPWITRASTACSRGVSPAPSRLTNLAARLCGEAKGGEILVAPRVAAALESSGLRVEPAGEFRLKGLARPIAVSRVVQGLA